MWVKIKSKKIQNTVLTVPYEAFISIYSKKGFVLVEDKSAKNSANEIIKAKKDTIKLDADEVKELAQLKEEIEGKKEPVVEEPKKEVDVSINALLQKQKEEEAKKDISELPTRSPIKKTTASKR